jgi:predicted tellurium resistance membrane protein TerC
VLYWAVLLGSCTVATLFATLIAKRPMLAAIWVSVLAGIGTGLYGARHSPLWIVGSVVVIVCSLPVTIVTGMVTERLRERWDASHRNDVPGTP